MNLTYEKIAGRIDHALLLPTMTPAEVEAGCRLADAYGVATVCVKPADIELAVKVLQGSTVKVGTVIGFPHGGQASAVKLHESRIAIESGARELDMVVNIGWARAGRWESIHQEIREILDLARKSHVPLKVIFENCYLDDSQKSQLCDICAELKVDFVKTSTGFGTGGATEADLILMRRRVPSSVKLKAAGGMRDLDTAIRFVEIGCDRLGTSKTGEILDALIERLQIDHHPSQNVSRETNAGDHAPGRDY